MIRELNKHRAIEELMTRSGYEAGIVDAIDFLALLRRLNNAIMRRVETENDGNLYARNQELFDRRVAELERKEARLKNRVDEAAKLYHLHGGPYSLYYKLYFSNPNAARNTNTDTEFHYPD
jgi:hypothetical protein